MLTQRDIFEWAVSTAGLLLVLLCIGGVVLFLFKFPHVFVLCFIGALLIVGVMVVHETLFE